MIRLRRAAIRFVRLIGERRRKDDRLDAKTLARANTCIEGSNPSLSAINFVI